MAVPRAWRATSVAFGVFHATVGLFLLKVAISFWRARAGTRAKWQLYEIIAWIGVPANALMTLMWFFNGGTRDPEAPLAEQRRTIIFAGIGFSYAGIVCFLAGTFWNLGMQRVCLAANLNHGKDKVAMRRELDRTWRLLIAPIVIATVVVTAVTVATLVAFENDKDQLSETFTFELFVRLMGGFSCVQNGAMFITNRIFGKRASKLLVDAERSYAGTPVQITQLREKIELVLKFSFMAGWQTLFTGAIAATKLLQDPLVAKIWVIMSSVTESTMWLLMAFVLHRKFKEDRVRLPGESYAAPISTKLSSMSGQESDRNSASHSPKGSAGPKVAPDSTSQRVTFVL